MKFEGREVVTIQKACQLCGVTRRTMYNWMDRGFVKYVQNAGGSRRIFVDTLYRKVEAVEPEVSVGV